MLTNVALISGTPSVGKTNLLRHARARGFVDVSLAKENPDDHDLHHYNVHHLWQSFFAHDDPSFIKWTQDFNAPVLLEWGYPPHCFKIIEKIARAGIPVWWINGDERLARIKHQQSGKSLEAFDRQTIGMNQIWPQVREFYNNSLTNHIIERLHPDGSYTPNEEILETIFRLRPNATVFEDTTATILPPGGLPWLQPLPFSSRVRVISDLIRDEIEIITTNGEIGRIKASTVRPDGSQ